MSDIFGWIFLSSSFRNIRARPCQPSRQFNSVITLQVSISNWFVTTSTIDFIEADKAVLELNQKVSSLRRDSRAERAGTVHHVEETKTGLRDRRQWDE